MAYPVSELVASDAGTGRRIQDGIKKKRKGDFVLKTSFRTGGKTYTAMRNENGAEEVLG